MSTSQSSKTSQPISEEAIRQRAYELWKAQGGRSNATDDWNEAKRQIEQEQSEKMKGFQRITSRINQPLIFVEKRFFEPCADWFDRAAIFQIIEKLSPIIEAIGVIMIPIAIWWLTETNGEVKERQEKATRGQQAVQSYLNQLSNILLQGGVEKLEKNEELRNITRATTLALFQNPDLQNDSKEELDYEGDRKGQIIRYLSETKLIQSLKTKDKLKAPIISLSQAPLVRANLEEADLVGANLEEADLERSDLLGADLAGANLEVANLEVANLVGANLAGANLVRANLVGANLVGANLVGANLVGANLKRANLAGANLAGANLGRANLAGANLERANLGRAKYTNEKTELQVCERFHYLDYPCATEFSPDFDPKAAKMVLVKNLDDLK